MAYIACLIYFEYLVSILTYFIATLYVIIWEIYAPKQDGKKKRSQTFVWQQITI
jgi:hypothetical protein